MQVSLEGAVQHAEWIVTGDVVRKWCDWNGGHRFIWTHTKMAVRVNWKGDPGSTLTVSEPGGGSERPGDAIGMVRYSPGEHVMVILYRTPIGLIRTVGPARAN